MIVLGLALSAVLAAIALLHFAWAARIWWPAHDEAVLARTVTGFPDADHMPGIFASMAVATALLVCVLLASAMSFAPEIAHLPAWIVAGAGTIAGLIFLARGVADFTIYWARLTPEEPFRSLDRRYYSPLCIAIGLGFALLIWSYWT